MKKNIFFNFNHWFNKAGVVFTLPNGTKVMVNIKEFFGSKSSILVKFSSINQASSQAINSILIIKIIKFCTFCFEILFCTKT